MKRYSPLLFVLSIIFGCNSESSVETNHENQTNQENHSPTMKDSTEKKVTGIGGIFFKAKDPKMLKEWYGENLGFAIDDYGTMFESRSSDEPDKKTYLQWSPFDDETKYFEPSEKEFMINYRVENIEKLVEQLKGAGVTIVDTIETYDYGKFIHIMDPENNKIELWEPVDETFTKEYEGETTK